MVSLKPEIITQIGSFAFTNTAGATLLTDAVIISVAFFLNRYLSVNPGRLQNLLESIIEYLYELTQQIAGDRVESIFPWFIGFFFFIFLSNILGLFPGFATIQLLEKGTHEYIPLLRTATSDLNVTIALSVVSIVATHVLSIRHIGVLNYLKRFFALNPIFMFVGVLELVGEGTKLISLSFRLFGNIFAGEVVINTISTIMSFSAFFGPLPFLGLEIIVALVQALVFAMLTMVFMSIMTTVPEH
ncbi:MAG: F0F1 ATP synthase subunit A [Endomicrobiales bacterium]|jgi:F-type H+-transporting ATPase subunit a